MKSQAYKWVPFYALRVGEVFKIGKIGYTRRPLPFLARAIFETDGIVTRRWRFVWLFRKVQTLRPYGPLVLNDVKDAQ